MIESLQDKLPVVVVEIVGVFLRQPAVLVVFANEEIDRLFCPFEMSCAVSADASQVFLFGLLGGLLLAELLLLPLEHLLPDPVDSGVPGWVL